MPTTVIGLKPGEDPSRLLALARRHMERGSSLHLVSFVTISTEEDVQSRLGEAKAWAADVAASLVEDGYDVTSHVDLSVFPGSDLLRIAEAEDADLIIIGLGKRSRVGKALLGSDAQSILLSADRPVLCLRIA